LTSPATGGAQPDHPDEQAELRERADGANEPNTSGSDSLRHDDTAPGVDPDEGEA
jgi:hypothetical protein